MIRLATLFSGIGAIEQALKKKEIDYSIVFACDNGEREIEVSEEKIEELKELDNYNRNIEINKLYNATGKENLVESSYKANYNIDNNKFYQDVRFLDGSEFKGKIDLLVGGSPCQAFSVNGKRGGFEDTRGTLFYEYARIIKEAQPKVFIFENVKGMITHDNGKTWEIIKETFKELNYEVYIKEDNPILNSKNYGMPQNRERLFVVGFNKKLNVRKFVFPEEVNLKNSVQDFLFEEVDSKYYLGEKGFKFVTSSPSRAQVNGKIMRCQKANQQFNWNGDFIFEELDKVKDREDILEKAYVGEWNGKRGVARKFTPRECLRLMGFNDDFKIIHNDVTMYRQSGNSIVVNVLEKLVDSIKDTGVWEEC